MWGITYRAEDLQVKRQRRQTQKNYKNDLHKQTVTKPICRAFIDMCFVPVSLEKRRLLNVLEHFLT